MLIIDPYGMAFDAVVVFNLKFDFLFKPICDSYNQMTKIKENPRNTRDLKECSFRKYFTQI